MTANTLPPVPEMYRALRQRNPGYDGVFFTAVRTTGIFCRPTCPAKKPKLPNVEFYPTVGEALLAGYRPCKRCRPLEPQGITPAWLRPLLDRVGREPARRWTDADLRGLDLDPNRVRRWFQTHHGMTFHAYQRARRLGLALGQITRGEDLTRAAYDHGFESLSGFRDAFQRLFGATPGRGRSATPVVVTRVLTPLGPMVACAATDGVCLLEFADRPMLETQVARLRKRLGSGIAPGANRHTDQLTEELDRYFAGGLRAFTTPLLLLGSPFQVAVWNMLRTIPYGTTTSYESVARDLGRPAAVRAAARANGDNRLALLVPCHRVIGRDGKLKGYGGGLWRKRFLLEHEARHA